MSGQNQILPLNRTSRLGAQVKDSGTNGSKKVVKGLSKIIDKNTSEDTEAGDGRSEGVRSLTAKEMNVLIFVESFIQENGISPSYQEICDHFGFASYNSVQRYLKQLEVKGYIKLPWGNQKRAITILKSSTALVDSLQEMRQDVRTDSVIPAIVSPESFTLPLLGKVAAGLPIEAYEYDEFIDVPASLVRQPEKTFALKVQGQSMVDDGILDGDVILVQKQNTASNGEIVVAVVRDEATVKRFYKHSKTEKSIELRPANSTMTSFWYPPSEVQIRGVVVGLIRRF